MVRRTEPGSVTATYSVCADTLSTLQAKGKSKLSAGLQAKETEPSSSEGEGDDPRGGTTVAEPALDLD